MHGQDQVLSALHQRHRDAVTLMEYNFLLLFAPVGLIQKGKNIKIYWIPPLKLFISFLLKIHTPLLTSIAAVLKAHTSLLLTNWACLAVVSLLTAGQIMHTHTQTLLLLLLLPLRCTVHKHVPLGGSHLLSQCIKEKTMEKKGRWRVEQRAEYKNRAYGWWEKRVKVKKSKILKQINAFVAVTVESCLNFIITELTDKIFIQYL